MYYFLIKRCLLSNYFSPAVHLFKTLLYFNNLHQILTELHLFASPLAGLFPATGRRAANHS